MRRSSSAASLRTVSRKAFFALWENFVAVLSCREARLSTDRTPSRRALVTARKPLQPSMASWGPMGVKLKPKARQVWHNRHCPADVSVNACQFTWYSTFACFSSIEPSRVMLMTSRLPLDLCPTPVMSMARSAVSEDAESHIKRASKLRSSSSGSTLKD